MNILVFDENNRAIALVEQTDVFPSNSNLKYIHTPEDFEEEYWINYTLNSNNEPILIASTQTLENKCSIYLNEFAQTKGYVDISTACSYASSSVTEYESDGKYAVIARDSTWTKLYQIIDDASKGLRPPIRCFEDIEEELPELSWPIPPIVTIESVPDSNTITEEVSTQGTSNTSIDSA